MIYEVKITGSGTPKEVSASLKRLAKSILGLNPESDAKVTFEDATLCAELSPNDGWIMLEEGTNKMYRKITEDEYEFSEHVITPETDLGIVTRRLNIQHYTKFEIIEYCEPFGYHAQNQIAKWLDNGTHTVEMLECIFFNLKNR
jgi:hypothetical protein